MTMKITRMKLIYALIILLIILFVVFLLSLIITKTNSGNTDGKYSFSEFCGISTKGSCNSDSDCVRGGCNAEVCQSKSQDLISTICVAKECFDDEKFNAACSCVEEKCQWAEDVSAGPATLSTNGSCTSHAQCANLNCNSDAIPGCNEGLCECISSGSVKVSCNTHNECSFLTCESGEIGACNQGICECVS
ncbi:MAG: eight-cysteine-cluster domain-containing protein [archaeon]